MIPNSFIQDLLARIDIVDVVERHVPLRKAGANYSACCPFHSEKSPSFTVSPAKQFYHCFGCGAHGSAIGFLMQHTGIGFIEAVEELATKVGMQVPHEHRADRAAGASRAPLSEIMAQAAHFYKEQLKAAPKAIDYLKQRGLTGEIAARYGLGYAPGEWQGLQRIFQDYDHPDLVECGLVIASDQGRRYDRFRDRIMFPILDQRGNVIGFGGRVIDQGEPKYLNSPETPLFEKGRELYGLSQARKAVHDNGSIIVVEGYMDVVGLAQLGVENVVASLGTATTGMHIQKLFKQANRVVFCFDRDKAGDKAAWRAMDVSLEYLADDKTLEILQMPGGQDPDEFIREHGKPAFLHHADHATKLSEFMVRTLENRCNPTSAEGRAQLVHEAKPLLQKISAPILRTQIAQAIARLAQLSLADIEAECGLKPLQRRRFATPASRHRPTPSSIEYKLLEIVLHRPEWAARLPLELIDARRPEGEVIVQIADAITHGELPAGGLGVILEFFRNTPFEPLIAAIAAPLAGQNEIDPSALEGVLNDAVERLRETALSQEIEQLTLRAKHGLTSEEKRRLTELLTKKQLAARAKQAKNTSP